jgi:hypothetical protein
VEPIEFWKFNSAIALFDFKLFGIRKSKSLASAFLMEFGKFDALAENLLRNENQIFM